MEFNISPHGGQLVNLLVEPRTAEEIKGESRNYSSLTLTRRQICDLELLMNGAFSPLQGFMDKSEYESVIEKMCLTSGCLWPIPITLDVHKEFADKLSPGESIALRDAEGFMHAVLIFRGAWQADKNREASKVYGTCSDHHPGVRYLFENVKDTYIYGELIGIQSPVHYEFENLWDSPHELRSLFKKMGWRKVIAFQTSKPVHRVQRDITLKAAKDIGAHILLHPTVGMTKPGDVHHYARIHCYLEARRYYPHNLMALSLLPLAMRMAGPREALWHAIVHQNYGCSHFIVGPKHAYPPPYDNQELYEPDQAKDFVLQYSRDLEIQIIPIEAHKYVPDRREFMPLSKIRKENLESVSYTDAKLKEDLCLDRHIPDWFSFHEVVNELRKVFVPRRKQGFTLFFTGFSGSGKSTLAKIIYAKLIEAGGRPVSLLDGDIVRQNLSSELGFSREHRDLNIQRIGFVASEITKNGGVAICAPIAPYNKTRRTVRDMIEEHGAFIEIHVSTPLDVCEKRDRKGLYAKAREGQIPEFTGISAPYEVPESPEIRLDTSNMSPMEAGQEIYIYLMKNGYLSGVNEYI